MSAISREGKGQQCGDAGESSLFDKTRVSKADPRVDAYGEVDELNATLGAARAAGLDADLAGALEQRRDAGATHEVAEPVANEDRADLPQAGQLAGRTEHPGDNCSPSETIPSM